MDRVELLLTELPAETTTDVSGGNNLNIPVTFATPIGTGSRNH